MRRGVHAGLIGGVIVALATWTSTTWAHEWEVGAGALAVLSADHSTRGGGVGSAMSVGRNLLHRPSEIPVAVAIVGEAGVLGGGGLVWLARAGPRGRFVHFEIWQPSVGVSLLVLGGGLVRTIDVNGKLAANPWSLQLGIEPLRFRLQRGWVSALRVEAGPNLFRSGNPPLTAAATLFEVGAMF